MVRHALKTAFVLTLLVQTVCFGELTWSDADLYTVEGRPYSDRSSTWDRLPERAKGVVRDPVWNLSRHSAGIAIRFITDSPSISVRWTLTSDSLEMPHMPATGVSGIDLYGRTSTGWRWAASVSSDTVSVVLLAEFPARTAAKS